MPMGMEGELSWIRSLSSSTVSWASASKVRLPFWAIAWLTRLAFPVEMWCSPGLLVQVCAGVHRLAEDGGPRGLGLENRVHSAGQLLAEPGRPVLVPDPPPRSEWREERLSK